jgi:hypothetical protein
MTSKANAPEFPLQSAKKSKTYFPEYLLPPAQALPSTSVPGLPALHILSPGASVIRLYTKTLHLWISPVWLQRKWFGGQALVWAHLALHMGCFPHIIQKTGRKISWLREFWNCFCSVALKNQGGFPLELSFRPLLYEKTSRDRPETLTVLLEFSAHFTLRICFGFPFDMTVRSTAQDPGIIPDTTKINIMRSKKPTLIRHIFKNSNSLQVPVAHAWNLNYSGE